MNRLTLKPILTAMLLGALLAGGTCDLRAATHTPEPNPIPKTTPAVCGETPAETCPATVSEPGMATPEAAPAAREETPAVTAPSPTAASGPETATFLSTTDATPNPPGPSESGTAPGAVTPESRAVTSETVTPETGTAETAVPAPQVATSQTSATTRLGLTPRRQPQHTLFVNAGYLALLTTINFKQSDAGSLNEGFDFAVGYNWTSRRGLGAGVIYSGGFTAAERNAMRRTIQLHYVGGEFVARQCVGRRLIFREAVGAGYGLCIRGYGDARAHKDGVGLHERASVEVMLTRWLGLSAEVGGQLMLFGSPDVGDGLELSIGGILRFQMSGGIRLYF